MAYCSMCGTQLSDGTKFCPKCGNPIGSTQTKEKVSNNSSNNNLEPSNETSVQDNEKDSLSTWEKIALGVAGFVAISGIFGGFGDGMWIAVLISLCALGAICAVFMGTIEKKYAWTTAIVSFLLVCGAIGASTPDVDEGKQEQAQTEQKQNEEAEATVPPSSNNEEIREEVNLDWLQGHWVYRQGDYEAHLVIMENTVRQYSTLNPEPTYYTFTVDENQLWVKPIKNDGTNFVATLDLQNHRIDYGNGNWMHKVGR